MHYLTRHLEALREFSHGDQHLRIGDDFFATDVDADYLIHHKRAKERTDEGQVPTVARQWVAPEPFAEPKVVAESAAEEESVQEAKADSGSDLPAIDAQAARAEAEAVEEIAEPKPIARRAYTRRAK